VIGSRKAQTSKSSREIVKYCSNRCRHQKPGEVGKSIEKTFVSLLNGEDQDVVSSGATASKNDKKQVALKKMKGETRLTVFCTTVEELIFGSRHDPEKTFGRKKNRAKRGAPDSGEWKTVDMEDTQDYGDNTTGQPSEAEQAVGDPDSLKQVFLGAGKTRAPQNLSDVNFSVGGERGWAEKIEETEELKQKRQEGQRKAEEKEAVRCAARRLCAFGISVSEEAQNNEEENNTRSRKPKVAPMLPVEDLGHRAEKRRKCEAVLRDGMVVEASFAKGEWGIRWRE
jgi:hypothetical protein